MNFQDLANQSHLCWSSWRLTWASEQAILDCISTSGSEEVPLFGCTESTFDRSNFGGFSDYHFVRFFFFFFVPRSNATNVSAFPTLLSGFFFWCKRKVLSCKHLNHPSYSNSLAKGLEIFTQLQGLSKLKEIKNFISKGNSKPARNCSCFFDVSCQESSMICCLLQTKRLVSARE